MSDGWIKLHRKIWDNPRSRNPRWVSLWIWLLTHASHRKMRVVFGAENIELNEGQLITSRVSIATALTLSESAVERLLSCMEIEQQIGQRKTFTSRLISILNWEQYQTTGQPNGQQTDSQADSSRTAPGHKQEGKELKKRTSLPSARKRNPLFDAIAENFFNGKISKADGSRIGKMAATLLEREATPEMVAMKKAAYIAQHPTWEVTPEAVVKHWPNLSLQEARGRDFIPTAPPGHKEEQKAIMDAYYAELDALPFGTHGHLGAPPPNDA